MRARKPDDLKMFDMASLDVPTLDDVIEDLKKGGEFLDLNSIIEPKRPDADVLAEGRRKSKRT
jgi:hypothetical protein